MPKRSSCTVLVSVAVLLAGCDEAVRVQMDPGGAGGGGGAPGSRPGLCPGAFAKGARAAADAPVDLSSCLQGGSRDVVIGPGACGPQVIVDRSFTGDADGLGGIRILAGGTLAFLDDRDTTIETAGIDLAGTLVVGDAECPIGGDHVATIVFTNRHASADVTKGITVKQGGVLRLYGQTGVADAAAAPGSHAPSWTHLAAPAGPVARWGSGKGVASPVTEDGTLWLADAVDWKAGHWIVVAGTDFSPDSAEMVRIAAVDCTATGQGKCKVTLDASTPLRTYHYGGLAPHAGAAATSDGVDRNYGVEERAEVGLLSRSVRLTSEIDEAHPHDGGEIHVSAGYAEVAIQGVELEKLGKPKLGSYPIHFHLAGAAGKTLVNSNSIHHSYNKCVTIHGTSGLRIANNVCARAVGHLFYFEDGTERDNDLVNNLGIGAMSNLFSIPAENVAARADFWPGDHLARGGWTDGSMTMPGNGYDGFSVPPSDDGTGKVLGAPATPSGFWITNPGGNRFVGNSIAGCQALGRGFWLLPNAAVDGARTTPMPAGAFSGNRAHGCYNGFDSAADDGVTGAALYTPMGPCLLGAEAGKSNQCDVVAVLDGLTATRNRNRGIWLRASWYRLTGTRLATNRHGVSLVSSGGTEGSPPGVWGLLEDAIVVGMSANNPLRFGPCPYEGQDGFGGARGCFETSAANGFPTPTPSWSLFGVMFYDGPARLEGVRFVNFKRDVMPSLTATDVAYLRDYERTHGMPCQQNVPYRYEGDAAIGWFQSNVNSYPPTQYVEGLRFENVDFRHQIYTASVENACAPSGSHANFRDGDKFTVIRDRDRSLTGLGIVAPDGSPVAAHPISLNNIPFLAGPGTADECLSTGQQDEVLEGRPTSLISPYSYATLEISAWSGPGDQNVLIVTKDQVDYGGAMQFTDLAIGEQTTRSVQCGGKAAEGAPGVPGHACVALTGRNGTGVYEPKVVHGLGYTLGATGGLPPTLSLMYTDANRPGGITSDRPFRTRMGLCYRNGAATAPPATAFKVYKGSKVFAGPNGNVDTLAGLFPGALACSGLDNVACAAPATGSTIESCLRDRCPSPPYYVGGSTTSARTTLPAVDSLAALERCPNGECFYYDAASGILFLSMVQEQPNPAMAYSSPLGTCNGMPGNGCADESFYSCPATGCELYVVQVEGAYERGPSACTPYGGAGGAVDYTQPYPADLNRLAYASGAAITTSLRGADTPFPHQALADAPADLCPTRVPATPDWAAAPATAVPVLFTLGAPAGVTTAIEGDAGAAATAIAGTPRWLLEAGKTYVVSATKAGCTAGCACKQRIRVHDDGNGFDSVAASGSGAGATCCQLPERSDDNQTGVADTPYSCAGP